MAGTMHLKRKSSTPGKNSSPKKPAFDLSSTKKKSQSKSQDEDLADLSDDSDNDRHFSDYDNDDDVDSEEELTKNESVQETRARLARKYLEIIEEKSKGVAVNDDSDIDSDDCEEEIHHKSSSNVAATLQRERLKARGQYEAMFANKVQKRLQTLSLQTSPSSALHLYRGHSLAATSCCLSQDGKIAYSGGKGNEIIQWDVEYNKKLSTIVKPWSSKNDTTHRTDGEVLSLDVTGEEHTGTYLAAGRNDGKVAIYDVRTSNSNTSKPIQMFSGHKAPVPSLKFRKLSPNMQLFTASYDRCIRHYSLDSMSYIETLYGHQGPVTSISCLSAERPVSVGRDRTIRSWNISGDSHAIFRERSDELGGDTVSCINDHWFVTGNESGSVSLWFGERKKAVQTIHNAHGGKWVTSSDSAGGDMCITGANDGFLNFYKVKCGKTNNDRGIEAIGKFQVNGFVNDCKIGPEGRYVALALGTEHKVGRWEVFPGGPKINRFGILELNVKGMEEEAEAKAEVLDDAEEEEEDEEEDGEDSDSDSDSE